MLLALLIGAAPSASQLLEGPWPAEVPRPIGASPIAASDYPADALQSGEQGVVRAALSVNARGRVSACTVMASSGSRSLDAATCRILTKRARFTAGQDNAGTPVPSAVLELVTWRIGPGGAPHAEAAPDAYRGPSLRAISVAENFSGDDYPDEARRERAHGKVSFRLDVDANGRVSGCTIIGSSGSASLDAVTCRVARARTRFLPARDAAGNAVPAFVITHVDWRLPRR